MQEVGGKGAGAWTDGARPGRPPKVIPIFTLVGPGAGFQQQSLSTGVKVAQAVEKKQEKRGKGEGDERQGGAKGQMGKRGEPEGAASLGDGWRRRPLACSMQTPPACLAGYTGVPNSPKSKPRASPCELCVLTSNRVYGLCQSYRMSPHNSRGPLSTLAPAVAGGLRGPQPGRPRAMSSAAAIPATRSPPPPPLLPWQPSPRPCA